MAKYLMREFACFVERVVDSDTVLCWVQIQQDVRVRWRIRLEGIEGGELETPEGEAGMMSLIDTLSSLSHLKLFFVTTDSKRDQFGRHIGEIVVENGDRLTDLLKASGHHWRRSRSGKGATRVEVW